MLARRLHMYKGVNVCGVAELWLPREREEDLTIECVL